MKKRTLLALMLAMMMLTTLLPASAQEVEAPELGGELKLATKFMSDPVQLQFFVDNIVPVFEEETGVKVIVEAIASDSDAMNMMEVMSAADNYTIDLMTVHDSIARMMVTQYDCFAPIDWALDGEFIDMFDDNFVVDGNRYFAPLQADTYLTIANKEAMPYLEELGYDIYDLTWEQLAKWSNLMLEKTGSPKYVFPAMAGKFAPYEFGAVQLAYGQEYVPNFDAPKSKEAFDLVAGFAKSILPSSPTIDFPTVPMSTGEAWLTVFHMGYVYTTYSAAPEKFVVAPVPKGPTGVRGTMAGGHGLGITSGAPNPDAAKAFVDFMVRDDIMYDLMYNLVQIPAKISLLDQLGDDPQEVIMKMGLDTLTGNTLFSRVRSSEFTDFGQVKALHEAMIADMIDGKTIDEAYLKEKQAGLDELRVE